MKILIFGLVLISTILVVQSVRNMLERKAISTLPTTHVLNLQQTKYKLKRSNKYNQKKQWHKKRT